MSDVRCQTAAFPYRHPERSRGIFVIYGQADDVWYLQTGNLLPTYLRASPFCKNRREASLFLSLPRMGKGDRDSGG